MSTRSDHWPRFFMQLAETYALRATCPRARVGCVIVSGKRQIGAGFNGSVSGADHCPSDGTCAVDGHCGRSIHAEVNAVLQALALAPEKVVGSVAYVTHQPCWYCSAILRQAGVRYVVYQNRYGVPDVRRQMLIEKNVFEIVCIEEFEYYETTRLAGSTV